MVLRDEAWHQDVDSLLASLRGEAPGPPRRSRRLIVGAVALMLVVLGLIAWWQWPGGKKASQDSATVAPCVPPSGEGWTSLTLNKDPSGVETLHGGTLRYAAQSATWRASGAAKWHLILKTNMENRHAGVPISLRRALRDRGCRAACLPGDLLLTHSQFDRPRTVGDALVGFDVTCEPVGYIELDVEGAAARIKVTEASEPGRC